MQSSLYCLFQAPLDVMTRLAASVVKAVILPLLNYAKHDKFSEVLVGSGVIFGFVMPGCEAMAGAASSTASKTAVDNLLVPLLAVMVVPAIFLNIHNDEQDRPPVRCEWAGGE
jgi:hypothetical protein